MTSEKTKTKPVEKIKPIPIKVRLFNAISDCSSVAKQNNKFVKGMAHNDVNDVIRTACIDNRLLPRMEHQFERTAEGIAVTSFFYVENPDSGFLNDSGEMKYEVSLVGTAFAYSEWTTRLAHAQVVGSTISYADKYAMAKGFFLRTSDEDDLDHVSNKLNKNVGGGEIKKPTSLSNLINK